MTSFKPGDLVNVVLTGARVEVVDHPGGDTFVFYRYGDRNLRCAVRLGPGVIVEHASPDDQGPVPALSLVERYGSAVAAAAPNLARDNADWLRRRIVVRELLEQVRQRLDPDNQLAVCPACAQFVQRHGDILEEHRSDRAPQDVCDPTNTLEARLARAEERAQAARRATSPTSWGARTLGPA